MLELIGRLETALIQRLGRRKREQAEDQIQAHHEAARAAVLANLRRVGR